MAEPEVWMQRLGCPGEDLLDLLPRNVTGILPSSNFHPFQFIDWKEEACMEKQAALCSAKQTTKTKQRFYLDFGFMRMCQLPTSTAQTNRKIGLSLL